MTVEIIGDADNGTVSITTGGGGTVAIVSDVDSADVVPAGDTVEVVADSPGTPITGLTDGAVQVTDGAVRIGHPTFVQDEQPTVSGPFVWWETDAAGVPVTVWVEDGQP